MRLAYVTPLPPLRTGIASYSTMLLPYLAELADVTVITEQESYEGWSGAHLPLSELAARHASFDAVVCQLGNNPYHEAMYRYAMQHPSFIVLHDAVLHHLIVEMTLARGDAEAYIDALRDNHGAAGEAWARGRVFGLHDEIGNFLYPASIEVARRSRGVIVHNSYAERLLRQHGLTVPIQRIDHPFVEAERVPRDRRSLRRSIGCGDDDVIVGAFGFVTGAKRPEILMEAFGQAAALRPELRLLIVGEPAPNVDLEAMAAQFDLPRERWSATGYVDDAAFDAWIDAVDRVVNLRYPTAGETSGAILHVAAAGKPLAVSDIGSFSDLPDSVATKIPLDGEEVAAVARFMTSDATHEAEAQRAWLMQAGDPARVARAYVAALRDGAVSPTEPLTSAYFPVLRIEGTTEGERVELRVRNEGRATLLSAAYGEPAVRLVAKWMRADREMLSEWLTLPSNLAPGETLEMALRVPEKAERLVIVGALEGVEEVGAAPLASIAWP